MQSSEERLILLVDVRDGDVGFLELILLLEFELLLLLSPLLLLPPLLLDLFPVNVVPLLDDVLVSLLDDLLRDRPF